MAVCDPPFERRGSEGAQVLSRNRDGAHEVEGGHGEDKALKWSVLSSAGVRKKGEGISFKEEQGDRGIETDFQVPGEFSDGCWA